MPTIEVDFETYKALVNRRSSEDVSEGDVVKMLLGIAHEDAPSARKAWVSEGVKFWVGTELRHLFRGGKIAKAEIVEGGVRVNGKSFSGVSPAAAFAAGHQANGWQFWEYCNDAGNWMKIDSLRHEARR